MFPKPSTANQYAESYVAIFEDLDVEPTEPTDPTVPTGSVQILEEFLMEQVNNTGWWLSPTPPKNDGVRTSWDGCSQLNGNIKLMFQTTNQNKLLFVYT